MTGAAGFLGGHILHELEEHGHHTVGVDRDDGDLRDPDTAERLIFDYTPEIVIHLAAKVGRLFGEDDPGDTIADNTGMTAYVAKACGDAGVRMVYASTSEVYGDNRESVCDEDEGPFSLPHNIYGLSKGFGEEVCRLYAPDDLVILRFSMPYGPGLPWGKGRAAIINMLWQAHARQPIPVHRGAERSWCWVGDTARAVRMIVEQPDGGAFNVGRDDAPVPMMDVARMACMLTGAPETLIREVDPPSRQTVVKRLATEKIRSLGWQPEVELEDGMRRTLRWILGQLKEAA